MALTLSIIGVIRQETNNYHKQTIILFLIAPILWNLLQPRGGRPRLPLLDPPATPTPPALRAPDPLEDFATFMSFCSKVYADQGACDLSLVKRPL